MAANPIANVGTNPVSGMTLMTLILASLVMVAAGLTGTAGMVAALVIGGVVCTALSMAGGFITDLKIGYWLGSTPAVQQKWKFLGTLVSAATVGGAIVGTLVGKNLGEQNSYQAPPQQGYRTERRCNTRYEEQATDQFVGYKNVATYKNQIIVKYSDKPLEFIRINVTASY